MGKIPKNPEKIYGVGVNERKASVDELVVTKPPLTKSSNLHSSLTQDFFPLVGKFTQQNVWSPYRQTTQIEENATLIQAETLSPFLKNCFDLVLTDLEMPIMDGWSLTHCIKERSPNTPVVLKTGGEGEMRGQRNNPKLTQMFNKVKGGNFHEY